MHEPDRSTDIDVHEAHRRHEAGALLLDVREPNEHASIRIPGSVLVPLSEFTERYEEDVPDDREILVYCRSGARSARVTEFLLQQGYDAANVDGGILAWKEEGLPVEEGRG